MNRLPHLNLAPALALTIALALPASISGAYSQEPDAVQFKAVTAPADLQFPRDHGKHPEYQTEWWYFTGHLTAESKETFGFELTFFRVGLTPLAAAQPKEPTQPNATAQPKETVQPKETTQPWNIEQPREASRPGEIGPPTAVNHPAGQSAWRTDAIYLAHIGLTDDSGNYLPAEFAADDSVGRFYSNEFRSRGSLGEAGAADNRLAVFLKSLRAEQQENGEIVLTASDQRISFRLPFRSLKPPVLQGENGFSRKGPETGAASFYYSLTRMEADCLKNSGCSLTVAGKPVALGRISGWMDHEVTSNRLDQETLGWDWFAIQLEDGSELMVYQLRLADGTKSPYSSGIVIGRDNTLRRLSSDQFEIEPGGSWKSPASGKVYPSGWKIRLPDQTLLEIVPTVKNQELETSGSTRVTYWEGRCKAAASTAAGTVAGQAYVELVGY